MFKTSKNINKYIWLACILALTVIMLGAYTRLTDSGLGCPDWPGCYGKLIVDLPEQTPEQTIEFNKAWTEMLHRYLAGGLGILIIILNIFNFKNKLFLCLTIIVILQSLLGMWTVTMKLYPIIVMAHLLGGMTILSLLWWQNLRYNFKLPKLIQLKINPKFNKLLVLSLCTTTIIILQILLGGWTSANYTALVCNDFPTCQGELWPKMDFISAFNFSAAGIFDSPGIPLENTARVTIQMSHRVGALLTLCLVLWTCCPLLNKKQPYQLRFIGSLGLILVTIQIALGITNVLAGLPLFTAVLHNGIAAMLFLCFLTISYSVLQSRQYNHQAEKYA